MKKDFAFVDTDWHSLYLNFLEVLKLFHDNLCWTLTSNFDSVRDRDFWHDLDID